MKRIVIAAVMFSCSASALLEHDRAAFAAQQSDWSAASSLLQEKILENPDDPYVLYDCGVAAYRQDQFAQAEAYFAASAQKSEHTDAVHEQALFNRGNAQVKHKKLEAAVESYEQTLRINPENEHARQNLEVVKKMLEQKQEEQKQEEQKQEEEKNEEEDSQDNEQGEPNGDEQREGGGHSDKDSDQKEREQERGDDKDESAERDTQGERGDDSDDQSQKDKGDGDDESGTDHDSSPEQKSGDAQSQDTQTGEPSQEKGAACQLSPHLAHILQEHEEHDAQLNKQHVKAFAGQQEGAGDERNCW